MPQPPPPSSLRPPVLLLLLLLAVSGPVAAIAAADDDVCSEAVVKQIVDAALASDTAYDRLGHLAYNYGPRLSGSHHLDGAIKWVAATARDTDRLDDVRLQPVMVPHWVRGDEHCALTAPASLARPLQILGLGGSVATPAAGLEASVLVVKSFDELHARAAEAKGRIVVYNQEWYDDGTVMQGYAKSVAYRGNGASEAARVGAIAALVRSVTPYSLYTPHTGNMHYADDAPRIPTASLTVEDAEWLAGLAAEGNDVRVRLVMSAQTLPDVESANVLLDLRGRDQPDEVVVIGGHLDSWDVGEGANDDGGGAMISWGSLQLLAQLGLRPRRTIRAVMFTNEENGARGGAEYAAAADVNKTSLAVETDSGVGGPCGFAWTGGASAAATATMSAIASRLGPALGHNATALTASAGAGTDVGPLQARGVPTAGLMGCGFEDVYFRTHHTNADTFDKIDKQQMRRTMAALATMAYCVADLEEMLPRK